MHQGAKNWVHLAMVNTVRCFAFQKETLVASEPEWLLPAAHNSYSMQLPADLPRMQKPEMVTIGVGPLQLALMLAFSIT